MNPSQEPADPQHPARPLADPSFGRHPAADAPFGPTPPAATPSGHPAAGDGPVPPAGAGGPFRNPTAGDGAEGDAHFGAGLGYGLAHPTGPDWYDADGDHPDRSHLWDTPPTARRPWRRTGVAMIVSAVAVLVLGAPLGLLWAWLAPDVPVIDTGSSGIVVNDPSPEQYIAADGWYTLLGLGFGLLIAVVAWLVLRRDRGPFLLLGVVAGTLGAGYLVGPWTGQMVGRSGYQHWRDAATQGATYLAPPQVHSLGPKLVPAFAAAIALTLLAGWSNDPDLDEPGAKPGYGPNNPAVDAPDADAAADPHDTESPVP